MKIAVVTDSNSGITQAEGKRLGIFVLPMPFMIDGQEYLEDITLTQPEFRGREYCHLPAVARGDTGALGSDIGGV